MSVCGRAVRRRCYPNRPRPALWTERQGRQAVATKGEESGALPRQRLASPNTMVPTKRNPRLRMRLPATFFATALALVALLSVGISGNTLVLCRQAGSMSIETLWSGCSGASSLQAGASCARTAASCGDEVSRRGAGVAACTSAAACCAAGPARIVTAAPSGAAALPCGCALDAPCPGESCEDLFLDTSAVLATVLTAPLAFALPVAIMDGCVPPDAATRRGLRLVLLPEGGERALALARSSVLLI